MLLIQQLYKPQRLKSDYVLCPACKRGRLCDKPQGEKIAALLSAEILRHPAASTV